MIKSTYTDDWRLINKLSVDWPFTQEEVYTALENEEYVGDELRAFCHHIKSPVLQFIFNTVEASIPNLLREMNEQSAFQDIWNFRYKEQIFNNTSWTCHIVRDKPGYNTDTHIDCRTQVCTGMLFFNSFDDSDQSTSFYTSFSKDSPIRMSSKFGDGWFSANTQINWHIGANNTQRNRYAILFIINLDLK